MKIIIPMAGMGKRMRPHTLVTPKPLIELAGKPIVHHIVEELARTAKEPIEEIGFVVGRFGEKAEKMLIEIAEKVGAKGSIFYQDEPLGTAHAVLCAKPLLSDKVIVAFADTIFKAEFKIDMEGDSTIFVQEVEDPRAFGVVKLNDRNEITDFVEKPQHFVSNLAIIGIYYFKDGDNLKKEINYLIDNDIKEKGEYQLTNALENMKQKGLVFKPGKVDEWLDCGNKDATVYTHGRVLDLYPEKRGTHASAIIQNSTIIEPCYIGENAKIINSVVGPGVSIGKESHIENCVVKSSIIQQSTTIKNVVVHNSMVGNNVVWQLKPTDASIGDFTTLINE
jgi:glucose-1-phosphate thymidylyltransferase